MNTTVSLSSSRLFFPSSVFDLSLLRPKSQTLRFRTVFYSSPGSRRFVRVSPESRSSSSSFIEPQLDDVDEEFDEEFDDEEDDDEGEDIAADEYDDFSGDLSDEEADSSLAVEAAAAEETGGQREELKWQRVEKLRGEVREFGEEIIDVDELASIYDFRIDKFQVKPNALKKKYEKEN